MSNGLDPDEERCFVGPDLGLSCCKGYQQTTKDATSKERDILNLSEEDDNCCHNDSGL